VQFLKSYLAYGAWLRCISARRQLEIMAQWKECTIERLAATANFYQQVAMQTEDISAMLIAIAVLQQNKEHRIPNILRRISFATNKKTGDGHARDCIYQLAVSDKTVRIDVREIFKDWSTYSPVELVQVFGLKWSKAPSVKTVPRYLLDTWLALPSHLNDLCHSIYDTGAVHLTGAFNKIKHGPQLDVVDYFERLRRARASQADDGKDSIEEVVERLRRNGNHPETIRVLFDGANVAHTDDEKINCLFLEDNPSDLMYFFHEVVSPLAIVSWYLISFIYVQNYHEKHVAVPTEVEKLFAESKQVQAKSRKVGLRIH